MATNPGCINPSSIWSYNVPCSTSYQPFESRPIGDIRELECSFTQMGPSSEDDPACWGVFSNQPSDCPEEWTSAGESSYEAGDGATFLTTYCCPTVYPFTLKAEPKRTVTTIDDTEYSIAIEPSWLRWSSWCGATSVEALSGQPITMTGSGGVVTEAAWNFENDVLAAPAAPVTKYIYAYEDTTSICSGRCTPEYSNPLKPANSGPTPTPTPAPTGTYVSPPSHATTQFTPGESCMADSMKWLVSTTCNLGSDLPGWVECAITMTGNPLASTTCNPWSYTTGEDHATTWYDECPVGYKVASSSTYWPFFSVATLMDAITTSYSTTTFDAVERIYACCPDGAGFEYLDMTDGTYATKTINSDGQEAYVSIYVPPRCVATHVDDLADHDVALTMIYNPSVPDKRKRQDEAKSSIIGTTTRKWDVDNAVLFAQPATYAYTVFHGTYTCFESCREYFTYSYNNTNPNYTPTPSFGSTSYAATTTDSEGSPSTAPSESRPAETTSSASKLGSALSSIVAVISCIFFI